MASTRISLNIFLQINSPDVPDLTVVDLPGTTTIPMKNQPQSIVADLENMALHYISDPNSIILAVTPANADVANSQALQLAGRVDPGVNSQSATFACDLVADALRLLPMCGMHYCSTGFMSLQTLGPETEAICFSQCPPL